MIFYAIREKFTGYYLPQVKSGFTRTEPEKDCIPRLHKTKTKANLCLAQWLKGECELQWDHPADDGPELFVTPIEGRKRENMEVVIIIITEPGAPAINPSFRDYINGLLGFEITDFELKYAIDTLFTRKRR